jgi:hypothetical protein
MVRQEDAVKAFRVSSTGLPKVRGGVDGKLADAAMLTATVKVSEPGYLPPSVKLRGWIADDILTADIAPDQLAALDADPNIVSIAIARPMRLID